MTISPNAGTRTTIGDLVKKAYAFAGLLHPVQSVSMADKWLARALLQEIVQALPTQGTFARALSFVDVALTIGTYRYPLDSVYLGSVGHGAYIPAGTVDLTKATGESPVIEISRERWQNLSTKSSESARPSQFFLNRELDELSVYLWPIPAEAGTIRFQLQRMLADCDDDNATLDLEPFWDDALLWVLSAYLQRSKGLPITTWTPALQVGEQKIRTARGRSNERLPTQATMGGIGRAR